MRIMVMSRGIFSLDLTFVPSSKTFLIFDNYQTGLKFEDQNFLNLPIIMIIDEGDHSIEHLIPNERSS